MKRLCSVIIKLWLFLGLDCISFAAWQASVEQEMSASDNCLSGTVCAPLEHTDEIESTAILGRCLIEAVKANNGAEVKRLLEKGAPVDTQESCYYENPYEPVLIVARSVSPEAVGVFWVGDMDMSINSYSYTALTHACNAGNSVSIDIIRSLIVAGADLNVRRAGGLTALMDVMSKRAYAAQEHTAVARMLILAGADVDLRDSMYGYTALGLARYFGVEDIVSAPLQEKIAYESRCESIFCALKENGALVPAEVHNLIIGYEGEHEYDFVNERTARLLLKKKSKKKPFL